ncbi:MAG TPA: MaoC family dehydratase [Dehalococcoidales bacterium]|nr:MaoC family dehydratase [Dehalococcoidales bacterium]
MTEQSKKDYNQLTAGFEFPPRSYLLDKEAVELYLGATQETDSLFLQDGLVPPMAVTAFAMATLVHSVSMPSGTIHVSQELDFLELVRINDTITCYAKVSRRIERGGLRLMNIDIRVVNQDNKTVLTGKVGFVLPESRMGEE